MVLRELRKQYPLWMRVELVSMDDPQAPLPGTMGTVMDVDSLGTIHVRWDNGSTLGVVYGIDSVR
jgi:hypothetical protein